MSEKDLFIQYKENKDIELRNQLVEKYLYMVDILIRKYIGKGVEYDDLYQVGALALVLAVERFEPDKGYEFSSFATPTILGEIKKYFRDKQWSLKVPRRLKEISLKVNTAKEKLYNEYNRKPTVDEIAKETGLSSEVILEAMESAQAYGTYSLDKTFDEAGADGDNSFLEKYTGFEEIGFERIETSEIIDKVLKEFNDQYRYIFKERFIHNRSQSEIAKVLGVSQMTVSRAEKNIIAVFKKEFNK